MLGKLLILTATACASVAIGVAAAPAIADLAASLGHGRTLPASTCRRDIEAIRRDIMVKSLVTQLGYDDKTIAALKAELAAGEALMAGLFDPPKYNAPPVDEAPHK